jgi:acyl dehydratase
MLEINQEYLHEFKFSQSEVLKFAELTGDNNPVHTDDTYASKTIFKRPVIHGMLGASIFSKIFGTLFPGEGTIYLGQNLNFMRPMYPDTEYEAVLIVKEVLKDKHKAVIETIIKDKLTGKICTSGEATLYNANKI